MRFGAGPLCASPAACIPRRWCGSPCEYASVAPAITRSRSGWRARAARPGGRGRSVRPRPPERSIRHGRVTQLVAPTNADDDLNKLESNSDHHQAEADCGHDHPGPPRRDIVMLQAPRHPKQPDDIERHEGDIKADQREPECRLAETLVQPE